MMDNQSPQTATAETGSNPSPQPSSPSPDINRLLAQSLEYLRYLLLLQVDRLKFAAFKGIFLTTSLLLALVVVVSLLATASTLLLIGLAVLLGDNLGSFCHGAILVGSGVLLLSALGLYLTWVIFKLQKLRALKTRYAKIKQEQRTRFGQDIEEAARG